MSTLIVTSHLNTLGHEFIHGDSPGGRVSRVLHKVIEARLQEHALLTVFGLLRNPVLDY